MSIQSEAALEAGLIATLRQMGYEYVQITEEDNLYANFKRQLEIHNKKQLAEVGRNSFTDEEFEKIVIYLEGGTRFEKAKKLRDLYPLDTANGQRIWVEFLNRTQWCQNEFQVSNQITVEGRKKCRYDVTILINGLPLVQIELKRRGVELKQAYNQIQRYHKTSFHGLFDYIQLFVISNGVNTRYFANNPNGGYKFTFNWTDAANMPFNELDKFAVFFLEKCTLGKIIGKYIVLHEGDKCLMVLRPYQFYAVEKILDRVQNSNDNGYIWHTTGAGKTLTSFKTAQLVSELDDVDKVMFVVDRHDLDTQTQSEYEAFEPGAVDGTDNTDELVKRLHSNINQIEYLGRSFAAKETLHYNVVKYGDIVYTKSPTGDFPYGIVKRSYIKDDVAVSPLYGVYMPVNDYIGVILHFYFIQPSNAFNYLHPLIQKGAKNTINITNERFLKNSIPLPKTENEAIYIANTLISIQKKIDMEKKMLWSYEKEKQYLLSKMFI